VNGVPGSDGRWPGASLALGPIPEVGFVLQCVGVFGALGAIAAARSFRRTGNADERWLITTRWATWGLCGVVVVVLIHLLVGVP
jgi:hypothetical protein